MTAEPRVLRTKAEEALLAEYRASRDRLAGGKATRSRRDTAFGLFEQYGLPHRRIESWKYTDLRALMRTAEPLAGPPSSARLDGLLADDPLEGLDRARIVVVNGVYAPERSDLAGLDGVKVESVADVLVRSPERVGTLFADADDPIFALNTALMQGGVVVDIAAGAKPGRPIEIVHLAAVDAPEAIFSHDVIAVGANAAVRLLDSYRGPSAGYQVNAITELDVGRGARVSFSRLQAEGAAATHLGSLVARVGADATLDHLIVSAGAALSRWQCFVNVAGRGAHVGFYGANMLSGKEHGDLTLVVTHSEGYSASRELFKSVVDDEAEGAFQGKIVVKPGAQKTDAKMRTQALLVSDRAQFASKPELEIFADDVLCGHGATAGQIDETMLFYLMARGIPRAEAEQLLIEAFLDDAIDAIGDEAIAEALKRIVTKWLSRRGGAS